MKRIIFLLILLLLSVLAENLNSLDVVIRGKNGSPNVNLTQEQLATNRYFSSLECLADSELVDIEVSQDKPHTYFVGVGVSRKDLVDYDSKKIDFDCKKDQEKFFQGKYQKGIPKDGYLETRIPIYEKIIFRVNSTGQEYFRERFTGYFDSPWINWEAYIKNRMIEEKLRLQNARIRYEQEQKKAKGKEQTPVQLPRAKEVTRSCQFQLEKPD